MLARPAFRFAWIGFVPFIVIAGFSGEGARAQDIESDDFSSDSGIISVEQVQQMSVVIRTPIGVIYTDPTGGKSRYDGHPAPDIVLVSHEHHEHYDADTLEEIVGDNTQLVVPPFVMEQLPPKLKGRAISLANGTSSELGSIHIEAIPAYGLTGQSAQWHPRGRGNGYVVSIDGRRIYIAGSSDAVPEMLQLKDIDIAFLPLYPPYALGVDEAIEAVSSFKPEITYIYQYDSTRTRDAFVEKARDNNPGGTRVIARDIGICLALSLLCSD
ncbi:L-ascorbate metabolism protein UlaG, beta-lactamase superfamily [Rhizobium sp. NFR07]|uniref:MBL fold metallo-hydrolase n=1 Tax=Rhizobium sp. NFR07 TaxID=1566262 RepID=UPI0008E14772|nr:MBL fold metallo-hydrolase [Rhizobium sp. NFR07]SFA82219.1 L-ascorbate metabolism protein UlaG, beta-lactamase superfamily [Rhizobium sp. NFR07]